MDPMSFILSCASGQLLKWCSTASGMIVRIVSTAHRLRMSSIFLSYDTLCRTLTTPGEEADVMAIPALSAVTAVTIQMYFPPLSASCEQQPLRRLVIGRDIQSRKPGMVVMWSLARNVPVSGPVSVNHFVPLILHRSHVPLKRQLLQTHHHSREPWQLTTSSSQTPANHRHERTLQ